VGRKYGRRNQRRPAKVDKSNGAKYGPWIDMAHSNSRYLSVGRGPMNFVYQFTRYRKNLTANTDEFQSVAQEDTIHPVELKFPAPLQEFGTQAKGFIHHWEKMTYLFDLPDPSNFPRLRLNPDERDVLLRFVTTCRHLAGYSAINAGGGISLRSNGPDDWSVYSDFPSHEAFTGLSGTFRQLHNDKEPGSYVKVRKIIKDAIRHLDADEVARTRVLVKLWSKARGELMQKMVSTLVCEKLRPDVPDDAPRTMMGVDPDQVIRIYNYGDSLHWGGPAGGVGRVNK